MISRRSPSTKHRWLGLLPVLILALAACAESSGSSTAPESAGDPPESMAPVESMGTGADASVVAADSSLGTILTDADGKTIYFFANDTEGVSNCADDCLANWPAVEASDSPTAGDGVTATLGTITRDDGTTQLTVNGFPAYYFVGDAAAGDVTGQGVSDIWWVFGADGEPIES